MAMSLSQARKIRRGVTTERPFDLPSPEEIRARLNEAAAQRESVNGSTGVTSPSNGSQFDRNRSVSTFRSANRTNKGSHFDRKNGSDSL